MISVKYALIIVAAFAAGSFFAPPVQQAIAAVIATDVACSQCVGINGDGTNDIKDGSVTNAKLGDGAVTTSKILDGTIKSSDVSKSFIEVIHLADTNCGCATQWDPNDSRTQFHLADSKVTTNSVVEATVPNTENFGCKADTVVSGGFGVNCDYAPPNGIALNYVVFNP